MQRKGEGSAVAMEGGPGQRGQLQAVSDRDPLLLCAPRGCGSPSFPRIAILQIRARAMHS